MQKYGFDDARDVLERASARETAARVAAGAFAKALLAEIGVAIVSHVVQIGEAEARAGLRPLPSDLATVDASSVRCFDPAAEEEMIAEIRAAAKEGDSLGGTVEVAAYGVPVGLGSHVHWDRKLDGLIADGLDEHPGGEGRLDRRRPGYSTSTWVERPRLDLLRRRLASTDGRPRSRAASRAASPRAVSSSPGRP